MAVVLGEPPVVVDAGGGVDSPACVASRAAWGNGVVREGGDCARGVGALTTAGGTTFLGVAWRSASRRLANAMLGEVPEKPAAGEGCAGGLSAAFFRMRPGSSRFCKARIVAKESWSPYDVWLAPAVAVATVSKFSIARSCAEGSDAEAAGVGGAFATPTEVRT